MDKREFYLLGRKVKLPNGQEGIFNRWCKKAVDGHRHAWVIGPSGKMTTVPETVLEELNQYK